MAALGRKTAEDVPRRAQILADHRRVGKRLTPPLLSLGNFQEVSWVQTGIPETIWLALCHSTCGDREAVSLCESVVEAFRTLPEHDQFTAFTVSNVGRVAEQHQEPMRRILAAEGALFTLHRVLEPLLVLYPACPLMWLWKNPPGAEEKEEALRRFKALLSSQFDKTAREAMFVQTTLVHLAFAAGRMYVREGLSLENYERVQDYPFTEESRLVAASVRATVNTLLRLPDEGAAPAWSAYFWNRGLELEPCQTPDEFSLVDVYAQNRTVEA